MAGYSTRRKLKRTLTAVRMKIFTHWLEMTGLITVDDIDHVCDCLNIPPSLLKEFTTRKGTYIATYSTADDSEAVYFSIPADGYGRVTLRGSYFDTFSEQSMQEFIQFMYSRKGNCKRLDISLKDTAGLIQFVEYARMSSLENYLDYCTGSSLVSRKKKKGEVPDSNNRQGVPDVHQNHTLIHYGDANSSSYAKLYICLDGFSKFEVTLTNKDNAKVLLDAYNHSDMTAFNALAKAALVKTINFVKPGSKVSKRLEQIASFKTFLGSEIKPVSWSTYSPAKQKRSVDEALIAFRDQMIAQLWTCIPRFDIPTDEIEALTAAIEATLKPQEAIF